MPGPLSVLFLLPGDFQEKHTTCSFSYFRPLLINVNVPDRYNIRSLSFLTLSVSLTLLYFSPSCSSPLDTLWTYSCICSLCPPRISAPWGLRLCVCCCVHSQHLQYCLAYICRMIKEACCAAEMQLVSSAAKLLTINISLREKNKLWNGTESLHICFENM